MNKQKIREALEKSLQQYFPNIWLEITDIESADPETLLPEEKIWIKKAYQGRKKEFTAGRIAARKAIERSGLPSCPIPSTESRLPLFPKNRLGSITHNKEWAMAAVAIPDQIFGLGIDLENCNRLNQKLWSSVFTQSEQDHLSKLGNQQTDRDATIFFSAKEAFYKAQYLLTKKFLGFQDASVEIINEHQIHLSVKPEIQIDCLKEKQWTGYYHTLENSVFTLFGKPLQ